MGSTIATVPVFKPRYAKGRPFYHSCGFPVQRQLSGGKRSVYKGEYGVLMFRNTPPQLSFVSQYELDQMFEAGWLTRANPSR
jgi:hypothetical protein